LATKDKQSFQRFLAYVTECGLEAPLRAIALRHAVTLQEAHSDARSPSVVGARVEMWYWLTTEVGRTPAEVAAIFGRDRGAVFAALKKLQATASELERELAPDTVTSVVKLARIAGRQRKCG
jgi:chromosomal replication initiation ATPase DnaA